VVLGQLANAFACRSQRRWALGQPLTTNPLLLGAVSVELAVLFLFLALPPLPHLLGGAWPSLLGWALAAMAVPFVLAADALHKAVLNRDVVSPPSARCSIPVRAENHGGREGVNS
jgi:hypothetical protein